MPFSAAASPRRVKSPGGAAHPVHADQQGLRCIGRLPAQYRELQAVPSSPEIVHPVRFGLLLTARRKQFPHMRTLLCSLALTLTLLANASAGRLDLAIVVFPEEKGVAELEAALANERLAEITDSDRTMTKESYLKGGYVLYAQSIAINPGSPFGGSVRIKNNRADLEGRLANGNLDVTISLSEGGEGWSSHSGEKELHGIRSASRRTCNGDFAPPRQG